MPQVTEMDRAWMAVLAARSARVKAQKAENDAIDKFQRAIAAEIAKSKETATPALDEARRILQP